MLENHQNFIELSKNRKNEIKRLKLNEDQHVFYNALIAGNYEFIKTFITERMKKDSNVESIYLNLIQPVMYEIGFAWEEGKISVAQEHLSSAIITRIMASLDNLIDVPKVTKGKILISSAVNELHELGAWMTANIFELNGWDVFYLGANVPRKDLIRMIQVEKPDIVGISITMAFNLENGIKLINDIRAITSPDEIRIIAGGSLFSFLPEITSVLDADLITSDFNKALEFATDFWRVKMQK